MRNVSASIGAHVEREKHDRTKPGMRAGTETGSLINHMFSRVTVNGEDGEPLTPEPGMGATILEWTDRRAGTILSVSPHQIKVQEDKAVRTDGGGMSEQQTYSYSSDPGGVVHVFRMTRKGWRNSSGNGLLIGVRDQYYDFSF